MSHYKAFDHQHLGEINQSVNQLQADYTNELIFVPNRGILQEEFLQLYIRQSRKA
jgi:N-acetyl-gamma-glutamylphosphate reductase